MTSKISTERRADPPITIPPARFRGASSEARSAIEDRRYIDDQIVGIERHLETLLLNGVIGTWARVSPASAADVQPGDVVCLFGGSTPTELRVILANSAALADAGAPLGIALTAAAKGTFGQFAIAGAIPQSVTGLDAAAGFARIDANGHAEWVANYSDGDYPLGTVDGAGSLAIAMVPRVGSVGVAGVNVVAPILNTGSVLAPVLELAYDLAPTADKVPIRGSAGEASFARVYGTGTVNTTAFISVGRGLTVLGGRTVGGVDHAFLAEDGTDGLLYGARQTAKHSFFVSVGGYLSFAEASVEKFRADATGFNLPTGLTFQVNGVGHTSAATALSLAFRDAAALLGAAGFHNGSGAKASAGTLRGSASGEVLVAIRDAADTTNIDIIHTEGDDVIHIGSGAAACLGVMLDANGSTGKHDLAIDGAPMLRAEPSGVTVYGELTTIGFRPVVAGSVITGAATLDTSASTVLVDAAAGSFSLALPPAASVIDRIWTITKVTAANTVTLDADGTEKINGALTYAITAQWKSIIIQAINKPTISEWIVIGST